MDSMEIKSFYKKKKVLITGHTGFKGSWLCQTLLNYGANVCGISLKPNNPSLFLLLDLEKKINNNYIDIRSFDLVKNVFDEFEPEIVFHLAAQPLVRESYKNPRYTYETNVIGSVNICDCIRQSNAVKSFINVTTDKVYENIEELNHSYKENEKLDGFDPYSNSKSCSELVTHSYINSFFKAMNIAASTCRAGNVIGGGDFSKDRIIPDCVKAAVKNENIIIRNPYSIRPYQHVLEPLYVYLMIAAKQYENSNYSGYFNVGPNENDCYQTKDLVDKFVSKWGSNIKCIEKSDNGPHEANFLKLDCSKLKSEYNWQPRWNLDTAIEKVVEWSKCWAENRDIEKCTNKQISEFFETNYE